MQTKASLKLIVLLVAAAASVGCLASPGIEDEGVGVVQQAEQIANSLEWNGLTENGFVGNGFVGNGFVGNGLTENGFVGNGLAWGVLNTNAFSREFLKYVVSCALPATADPLTLNLGTPTATPYTFYGAVGLAPGWALTDTSSCDGDCQNWVSACVLARVNFLGEHIQLSIRNADNPKLSSDATERSAYSHAEATYFGNVLSGAVKRYACNAGTDSGEQTLIQRPCGTDIASCVIQVLGPCSTVCTIHNADGSHENCLGADGLRYSQTVTVYRQSASGNE